MAKDELNLEEWKTLTDYPRLGEVLLQHRKITFGQLAIALEEQKKQSITIGEVLLDMNLITKDELIEVLELQSNIDRILDESYIEMQNLKNELG